MSTPASPPQVPTAIVCSRRLGKTRAVRVLQAALDANPDDDTAAIFADIERQLRAEDAARAHMQAQGFR